MISVTVEANVSIIRYRIRWGKSTRLRMFGQFIGNDERVLIELMHTNVH